MGDRLTVRGVRVAFAPSRYAISRAEKLRLAIPPWVGEMNTGNGHDHFWRNDELRKSWPWTETAGILTKSVKSICC